TRAQQARTQHTSDVEHQDVARLQELRELGETPVLDATGFAMDHEQTALVPAGSRQLRDLLRRQIEIVVAGTEPDLHRSEQRALLRPRCLETEVAIRLCGGEP